MNLPVCWVVTAALLVCPLVALADEATDTFNKLYGDDLKRVAATPSPADDVALAKQLLEAAGKVTNQKDFLALLCEKTYELAIKDPTGYPTAKAAMELLAANVPEKKVESLQMIAAMYQRPYAWVSSSSAKAKAGEALIESLKVLAHAQAAAEDIDGAGVTLKQALAVATTIKSESKASVQAQLAGLAPQQQVEKQIAALKAKLEKDPKDAASRKEIVRLYVVEMNNPAEAAAFVDETLDEATRKFVPSAAKPIEKVPEAACIELGDWYKGWADQAAAPTSKGAMLQRARAYYDRFLDLHKADDVARAGATLMLKKLDDALAKLGPLQKSNPATLTLDLGNEATMKMVLIRPGKFMMGSLDAEKGHKADEGLLHEVTISKPFYMGVTEVSRPQYVAVMGTDPSDSKGPTNPVDKVSWNDATEFCRKLSEKTRKTVRLPTEAEWEYACRAGSKTPFSFGDSDSTLGDYAWYANNCEGRSKPVGQKKPNAWGLLDMNGNVCEWCADWYGPYSGKALTDPQGAASGTLRVVRGGSFRDATPEFFRCATRFSFNPTSRYGSLGFRCAVTP